MRRNRFFHSERGFSLAGTLVAVAIGAIVASLVATVISEAVKGQRNIIDRDEMSEFTTYMKSLLANDSSCTALLRGVAFPIGQIGPAVAGNVLALNENYQDKTGPITEGFVFTGDKLRVEKLRLRDKGVAPFVMKAEIPGVGVQTVHRVMAQITLQVAAQKSSKSGGALANGYRPRFFEIPVHIDPTTNAIVSCNNEFNIADACAAIGFKYNPTPAPGDPFCEPDKACMSGGSYGVSASGNAFGGYNNPATGAQNCPNGFTPVLAGANGYMAYSCGKNCCGLYVGTNIYQCLKCP